MRLPKKLNFFIQQVAVRRTFLYWLSYLPYRANMRTFTLTIAFFCVISTLWSQSNPGPYQVGTRDLTFNDPGLSQPDVDVRIYYPGTTSGNSAPVATGIFPVVAFGHGFNLGHTDYEDICGHLATWGFHVISPDVQNGFSVDHQEYARELAACVVWMQSEGQNSSSDFFTTVDSMSGVFGHSMGGGASCLVPGVFPGINAVSGMASAETNPSAIAAMASYSGPYQIISGDADNTAPEMDNQIPMYNAATGEKQWVSIKGGAHCKFTDNTTICDLVSSAGSISRADQIALAQKYTAAFFNYYLRQDQSALPFLCGDSALADQTANITTFSTTINCNTVGIADPQPEVVLYPNPAQNSVCLEGIESVEVFSVEGRSMGIYTGSLTDGLKINTSSWPQGMYWVRGKGYSQSFVRQ